MLVVGTALALWQLGVLNDVAPIWIATGVLVAVGIGIMMARVFRQARHRHQSLAGGSTMRLERTPGASASDFDDRC